VRLLFASAHEVEQSALEADLVVGAVLVPGAAAPRLLTRAQIARMQPGSVLVDVAIDQGGCFETSRATTHAEPTYVVDGVVHYCVANMPGAVARTSTWALNNATLPFTLALADKGWAQACREDEHLLAGLNVHEGQITYEAVGASLGLPWMSAAEVVG
jgi:alanine dehydrogenase